MRGWLGLETIRSGWRGRGRKETVKKDGYWWQLIVECCDGWVACCGGFHE